MSAKLLFLKLLRPALGRFPRLSYPVATVIGTVSWWLVPGVRARLTANLLPVCDGDEARARASARSSSQNIARYWVDICTLPYRSMAWFARDHVRIINPEHLDALDQPGPVIAVSAHTGNAELVVRALDYRGREFGALVEALRPRAFARELLSLRRSGGGKFYETGFGGVRACLEILQQGGLVGVMGDRDIQGHGVCVTLFDRCVRLPVGPWDLARRTGARIAPVFTSRRRQDHFDLVVEPFFTVARTDNPGDDIRAAAQHWARLFEQHLRRDPGQWTVLEDYWRAHGCGQS